jgi:hypothetical protein
VFFPSYHQTLELSLAQVQRLGHAPLFPDTFLRPGGGPTGYDLPMLGQGWDTLEIVSGLSRTWSHVDIQRLVLCSRVCSMPSWISLLQGAE